MRDSKDVSPEYMVELPEQILLIGTGEIIKKDEFARRSKLITEDETTES